MSMWSLGRLLIVQTDTGYLHKVRCRRCAGLCFLYSSSTGMHCPHPTSIPPFSSSLPFPFRQVAFYGDFSYQTHLVASTPFDSVARAHIAVDPVNFLIYTALPGAVGRIRMHEFGGPVVVEVVSGGWRCVRIEFLQGFDTSILVFFLGVVSPLCYSCVDTVSNVLYATRLCRNAP